MRAGLEPRPLLRKGVLAFAAHHWTAFVIPIHLSNSTCFFVPAAHFCARVLLFCFAHPNEGWRSAEKTLGCSGTRVRALTRHARRLARRLASLGRRSPLGAPPWRFWAPVPRFPHRTLPSSLRFGEQPDRSQRAPRVRVVVPGGRGPGASRGDGCEPAPRDATPRSIFGIASRRRPHERGCAPYISAALCSQAQNELKPSPQSEFEKSI